MYFIAVPLVVLLWIRSVVCLSPALLAYSECGKLMNIERLVYCCGLSLVDKFLFVGSNCTDYWNNFGACRYECLYKHWKLFDENNKIKKPELYIMITSLYNPLNGYNLYGNAFKEANEDCERLNTNYTDFLMIYAKEVKELGLNSNCRPEALVHSHCILAHVTHHCPKEFYRSVAECDVIRSLIPNCVPALQDPRIYMELDAEEENRNQIEEATDGAMRLRGYYFLLSSLLSLILSHISD